MRNRVLQLLLSRQAELDGWINERRDKKPSFNRNDDQGEFMGSFSRVLGHPEIQGLFEEKRPCSHRCSKVSAHL